jgi:hypothetical protein
LTGSCPGLIWPGVLFFWDRKSYPESAGGTGVMNVIKKEGEVHHILKSALGGILKIK